MLGLAAVGVGAWAAYGFFSTGAQPAEALPAKTLGYVSVDLDPSGGQKIEALRTLNKFPAFEDKVGISSDDDLRKTIFDKIQDEAKCEDLDYAKDIEPWLGDRAAIAAVDTGGDAPIPVVVVQVKDADAADAGLDKIKACGGSDDGGWAIEGDWAVITESTADAEKVVEETKDGSLADSDDFQQWTDEAGDAGVMTMYAGPSVGDYLADHPDQFSSFFSSGDDFACDLAIPGVLGSDGGLGDDLGGLEDDSTDPSTSCGSSEPSTDPLPDGMLDKLRDFKGMAATVRFDDGSIELEAAGDASITGKALISGGGTADVVGSLPTDTIAAFGVGFADGWFSDLVDYLAPYSGESADDIMAELSQETGLDLPGDAETLAGDSATISLGHGFDPESFFSSPDASGIPVGLKIKGDADKIQGVLDKLTDLMGSDGGIIGSDAGDGSVAIGPDPDYRASLLKDGGLGDDKVFKDVIRESDKASTVLFVNVNEIEDTLSGLLGSDDSGDGKELLDNLKPISGFGATGWVDDDVAHAVFRLSTD